MTHNRTDKPFRDTISEKVAVESACTSIGIYKATDRDDDGAVLAAAVHLAVTAETLLSVVAQLQRLVDWYEARDARFDEAAERIRGGVL